MSSRNLCREWVVRETDASCCGRMAGDLRLSPLAARILYNRGVRDVEDARRFLNTSLHHLNSPALFPDMDKAVDRILQAVRTRETILVYGDYDVDGLTAAAVILLFLRAVGLDPLCHVPDRLQEGYGFHQDVLPRFREKGVGLIITVDCGISALEAVQEAGRLGMDVIVTDHHECKTHLPPALAVLNPKIPGSGFPFRDLAGVGVAFYLVIALRSRMREEGMWAGLEEPNLLEYLDLVSLGTLADMVPLQQENRIFVKFGLQEITKGRRPGIHVLKQQTGIQGEVRHTRPVIFRIIPRINAPGRLGCSGVSLEILLSERMEQALEIFKVLEGRNRERKTIENEVYRQARDMAREQMERERAVLVLAAEGWHRGILGIVASRIAREYRRPVALVSLEGEVGKGSIRSVDGMEILDAVTACKQTLERYGGHRMAAGFSLKRENLQAFREAFEQAILVRIEQEKELPRQLVLDGWVEDPGGLDEGFWEELERIGPFGYGNEDPVLGLRGVRVVKKEVFGANHLRLLLEIGPFRFPAIGFGMSQIAPFLEENEARWNLAFTPQRDTWKGRTSTTLQMVDIQPA